MVEALRFAHESIQPIISAQWTCLSKRIGSEEAENRQNRQFVQQYPALESERQVFRVTEGSEQKTLTAAELQEVAYELGLDSAKKCFASKDPNKESRGLLEHTTRRGILTALTERFPDLSSQVIDILANKGQIYTTLIRMLLFYPPNITCAASDGEGLQRQLVEPSHCCSGRRERS